MTTYGEPFAKPLPHRQQRRPWLAWVLSALAIFVFVDSIFGDSGYLALRRAQGEFQKEQLGLALIRQENARLTEQQRRLKEDPAAIEEVARRELGLMRRGEVLIMLENRPSLPNPSSGQTAGVQ